jgi:hypothetical protein
MTVTLTPILDHWLSSGRSAVGENPFRLAGAILGVGKRGRMDTWYRAPASIAA